MRFVLAVVHLAMFACVSPADCFIVAGGKVRECDALQLFQRRTVHSIGFHQLLCFRIVNIQIDFRHFLAENVGGTVTRIAEQ